MKTSKYNRYIDINDKILGFNSVSCGFAEIDDETFEALQALGNGKLTEHHQEQLDKHLSDLQRGRFILPENINELSELSLHFAR